MTDSTHESSSRTMRIDIIRDLAGTERPSQRGPKTVHLRRQVTPSVRGTAQGTARPDPSATPSAM